MKGIITLCGSIRFEEYYRLVNGELTMSGWIVLSCGYFNHSVLHEPQYNAENSKLGLDKLHLEKIDMSDSIFVINPFHYLGKSTIGEISYAQTKGKSVYYWTNGDLMKLCGYVE